MTEQLELPEKTNYSCMDRTHHRSEQAAPLSAGEGEGGLCGAHLQTCARALAHLVEGEADWELEEVLLSGPLWKEAGAPHSLAISVRYPRNSTPADGP